MHETVDEAVALYRGRKTTDFEAVTRLLADLHGFCEVEKVDFDAALEEANRRYQSRAA